MANLKQAVKHIRNLRKKFDGEGHRAVKAHQQGARRGSVLSRYGRGRARGGRQATLGEATPWLRGGRRATLGGFCSLSWGFLILIFFLNNLINILNQ
jgi:hypothetical protein